ncbi:FecCD family ABC transporter permease [Microlunatus flavus]|uniref:Iron complex transport system permease protein n=1 Tax=Microlunatus flavus TaxID=1036181 RepID=A0A1H9ANH2_9ACTN|nr:iron chelate uptake ABC transporter family permease subunit [Microlunatus flavus]SEP77913.1 iron complex transport system permease protein [Microlunatus flavus]
MALTAERSAPTRRTPSPAGRAPARRTTPVLLLAGLALLLLVLASLAIGARSIGFDTVLDALTAYDPTSADQLVVVTSRLPRTVLGLLVGAALGLAGCVMQGVTRNPLADPGVLGVNGGAALAIVLGISVFGVSSVSGYVWFAFLGAAGASVLVYSVAALGREGATPVKLALAGAAVTAFFGAFTTALLLSDQSTFDQFRFWQVGSLNGRDLGVAARVLPFLLVGGVLALVLGRSLNSLAMGDDVARGLGARVGLVRLGSALAVVLLSGAATAAVGPVGFVGLTIPHVARTLVGNDYRRILPASMLLAPVLLLAADVVGRVVARPGEVQVAIVTAVLGAPVFVALVRRHRLAGL